MLTIAVRHFLGSSRKSRMGKDLREFITSSVNRHRYGVTVKTNVMMLGPKIAKRAPAAVAARRLAIRVRSTKRSYRDKSGAAAIAK